LDIQAAHRVSAAVLRLESGNLGAVKWFSGIGEMRIDHGPGYRVYLARDGAELIILFGGGSKARQQRDIERAKEQIAEYKLRKGKRA